ncbi:MAG: DUF6036 family nucleotidyltransferase [Oscillospiraceae bacterium]|nr:DUF6036 family nucleotidyltransferase [Oscillospiraceae bacterium]MCL2280105.1 DUF6036 family nucleotidyltransferase [Oscillospiraceae bacterium]
MSVDFTFSKDEFDKYLMELGKEFRRLNGKDANAEIVLIGGASVVINYDFRNMTTDADALIYTDAAMKDAINRVRDAYNLPHGWLNEDFKNTDSYTEKLRSVSVYYRTFSNILQIRTVAAEYLVAMKAMSGRQYKYDRSDIVGIIMEHEKRGKPIRREDVDKAALELYGAKPLPKDSMRLLDGLFEGNKDYSQIYRETRIREDEAKKILLDVQSEQPGLLNNDNLDTIIAQARLKKGQGKNSMLTKLDNYKEKAKTQDAVVDIDTIKKSENKRTPDR